MEKQNVLEHVSDLNTHYHNCTDIRRKGRVAQETQKNTETKGKTTEETKLWKILNKNKRIEEKF